MNEGRFWACVTFTAGLSQNFERLASALKQKLKKGDPLRFELDDQERKQVDVFN